MTSGRWDGPVPYMDPAPSEKGVCRDESEAGCSHIFVLCEELAICAPGLDGNLLVASTASRAQGTGEVWKAPVRPVTRHRQHDLRNHGETCSF